MASRTLVPVIAGGGDGGSVDCCSCIQIGDFGELCVWPNPRPGARSVVRHAPGEQCIAAVD